MAVILAIGIATAVNAITFGVLYDAIINPGDAGLSENGTTVLTTAFGGIIGVLGSYVGTLQSRRRDEPTREPEPAPVESEAPETD